LPLRGRLDQRQDAAATMICVEAVPFLRGSISWIDLWVKVRTEQRHPGNVAAVVLFSGGLRLGRFLF
jgi:hypothetical protein